MKTKRSPSLKGGLMFILIAMAVFGFVMFESGNKIIGNRVKVSEMKWI